MGVDMNPDALAAGQSVASDSGERIGRSSGGHVVLLRRRWTQTGFVVTVDAPQRPEVPTETITSEWATANAAFDRMMTAY